MRRHRWKLEESLKQIRKARPLIRPNVGFYRQLLMSESGMGLGLMRGRFWGVLIEKFDLYMKREEVLLIDGNEKY